MSDTHIITFILKKSSFFENSFYFALISFKEVLEMSTKVKTGQIAPVSGQYKPLGSKNEITLVQGKRVPPSSTGATTFTLVDKTKHKGGK